MKIYYDKECSDKFPEFLTEKIFVMPLEESAARLARDATEDSSFADGDVFTKTIGLKETIIFSPVENCDYAVIPYKWNGYDECSSRIIKEAKSHNKKTVAVFNDDTYPKEIIPPEDGYIFVTNLHRSQVHTNEYSFPAFCGDYYNDEENKRSLFSMNPHTVSFCGAITHRIRQESIDSLSKSKDLQTNFIVRRGFWAPEIHCKEEAKRQYIENIRSSAFNLCMRGAGNFSYRIYETMMMGRIPVVIDTDQFFPFESVLDYNEFCVMVDYTEVEHISEKIKEWIDNKSKSEIVNIQNTNRKIWEEYMSAHGWIKNFHREFETESKRSGKKQ